MSNKIRDEKEAGKVYLCPRCSTSMEVDPSARIPSSRSADKQEYYAALERDAARYRWLRDRHWSNGGVCVVKDAKHVKLGAYCPSGDGLDEAIDSAIRAEAEKINAERVK